MSQRLAYDPAAGRAAAQDIANSEKTPTHAAAVSDRGGLPRLCWVSGGRGERHPGVLLEWRRDGDDWEGRVAYGVLSVAGVRLVEQWVAAAHLEPA